MTTSSGRSGAPEDGLPAGAATATESRHRHDAGAQGRAPRRLDWARRPSPLRTIVVTVLIAAPSLALRLWHLDSLGLNSDEAVYAGQAASLAHDPAYLPYFPVFRAHPLLFQSLLSVEYQIGGVSPYAGRLLAIAFGLATVWVTYALGTRLYGRRVGCLAALFIGVMPYTVVVNRQIVLDGPMAFFAAVGLYLLVRFVQSERSAWLYAAAMALGLATLTKETAVLLLVGAYLFFALTRKTGLRLSQAAIALGVYVLTVLPYPISLALAGSGRTGGAFLSWQLLRRANHSWWFYATTVPTALGLGVLAVAVLGLVVLHRSLSWPEHLLLSWIVGPAVFFELWAVKGFPYLQPIAVPVAVLAALAVVSVPLPGMRTRDGRPGPGTWLRAAVAVALTASLVVVSWQRIQPDSGGTDFLAGSGGVPAGREAGMWVAEHVPEGAQMLAIGPSMANIIQFYGHRKVSGLSVSPNPLYRNPVYDPVYNPDLRIRDGDIQYLVWDSFSMSRSQFFSANLLAYAKRYHGRVVHQEFLTVDSAAGPVRKPAITIYEVRP